ncbi:conserved hypothetical protein [Uncinocarpus reesii 1704]|uniref:Thioredoxin-like fold domain-containing protein n=1 Tax=Uncinocarpus reesii (strain UAMH 1704) TaxID=336963 RepID=C4JNU2_UNCRE|nr:uncharacterized protein UREG_04412 [Uncinocarpus reesii 1704]EEP79566.1 conserved hypothetical protein [Uncinocarpus reesii 1704]
MSEAKDDVNPLPESPPRASSWIPSVPAPIKRVFDRFPLVTYPPNEIPSRSPSSHDEPRLYMFSSLQGSKQSAPSHNPQCLKWQAYLNFRGIKYQIVPSNNHASLTGSLPFLLPAAESNDTVNPVPSNQLKRWVDGQLGHGKEETRDMRFDAYSSLLDHRLRNAWIIRISTLSRANFTSIPRQRTCSYGLPSLENYKVQLEMSF